MNLYAVLGCIVIVTDLNAMLEGEAGILRELLIATKEVRESDLPGGTECVLAEGERRLGREVLRSASTSGTRT